MPLSARGVGTRLISASLGSYWPLRVRPAFSSARAGLPWLGQASLASRRTGPRASSGAVPPAPLSTPAFAPTTADGPVSAERRQIHGPVMGFCRRAEQRQRTAARGSDGYHGPHEPAPDRGSRRAPRLPNGALHPPVPSRRGHAPSPSPQSAPRESYEVQKRGENAGADPAPPRPDRPSPGPGAVHPGRRPTRADHTQTSPPESLDEKATSEGLVDGSQPLLGALHEDADMPR